jgi:hypothetical protein
METIRTVDDVVRALGGDTKVAEWLEITQGGVNHWKTRKEIPGGWHMRIYAKLLSQGIDCDPVVFGLSREDADILIDKHHRVKPRSVDRTRPSAHV